MKIKTIIFLIVVLSSADLYSQTPSASKLYKEGKRAIQYSKFDEALDLFSKAITLDPSDKDYFIARAELYERKKEYAKAIEDYLKVLELKEDKDIRIHTCDLYIRLDKYKEANVLLDKIFERDKWDQEALERRSWCLIKLKDFKEAEHLGSNGIQNYSENHLFHYYKAIANDSLKNYAEACAGYEKSIKMIKELKVNSEKVAAHFKPYFTNYALALYNKKTFDESVRQYTIATTLDPADTVEPKNYRIYYLRSFPYLGLADYTNVFNDLTKSIGMNQDDKETIFQRGMVNRQTSQFATAINDFTKHLALDENSSEGYYYRGLSYVELGKLKDAIADFKKAVSNGNGKALYATALAETEKKLYEQNRESDAPEIRIDYPFVDGNGFINVYDNQISMVLKGNIKDKSQLEYLKINGNAIVFDAEEINPGFKQTVKLTSDLRKLEITVSDIYHNSTSKTLKVGHVINDSKMKVVFAGNIVSDDEIKDPFVNRDVFLVNETGEVFFAAKTDAWGHFKFENIPYDQPYFLTMDVGDSPLKTKQKFMITDKNNHPVLVSKGDGEGKFRFEILPKDENTMTLMSVEDAPIMIDMRGKLIAGNSSKTPLASLSVLLLNQKGELLARVKTDAFGVFLFSKLLPHENYILRTDSAENTTFNKIFITDEKGAIIKELTKNAQGYFNYELLPVEKMQMASLSTVDPWLKALNLSKEKNEIFIIENIYYASNSADILQDAEAVMMKAINAMLSNTKITIEVQSHTDAVASDEYNMELSQKRAATAVAYMISKGVDKKRLTAKGFGETQLINSCTNDVECSDAEHKQNRRTVFKINYIGN